jgi:hypothetical protein
MSENKQQPTARGDDRPTTGQTHGVFEPHPLLPLPPAEKMAEAMQDPAQREELLKFLNERRRALDLAKSDPLNHRLRLPGSRVVDALLNKYQIVYEAGGKRAGKTVDGVPRFLKCCLKYGKAKRWCMQDNAKSSIANLQQLVWENLPPAIQKLNMKGSRDPNVKYRVHYKPDTGFDGVLILPNECEIHFLNYTMNPSDYLGWKLGKERNDIPLDPEVPDIGALLDENCPLAWLDNIIFRVSDLGAKIHWMYSPQDGITPAIKAVTRGALTVESAPSDLLSDRVNIPGLPKGHMPRVRSCVYGKVEVGIYHRFTQDNPFSRYNEKGGLRDICEGRDKDFIMRNAYGYCEDVRGRACPKFGEWNIVAPESVPADGTNYMVTDPAGARNWFTFWARATPGGDLFVYREWPDWKDFGDWAVVSQNPKKLNGDRGPAQPTIGYGPAQYKNLFLQLEKIHVPQQVKLMVESGEVIAEKLDEVLKSVNDPHHRARIKRAMRPAQWPERAEDLDDLRENIYERLIDPRAARNQSASDGAFADLVSKLESQNRDERTGAIIAEPMDFIPAPGLDLRDGISAINELLYFNDKEERIALINAPKLYISSACRNLIWALSTYSLPTDSETTDDACEDPMDGLRYLATRGARYVVLGGKVKTRGGGSY